jgi:predicted DNA-binding ribbon-helix-helix protein
LPALSKRSLTIAGHRTSLALEPEFWSALEGLARRRKMSLPQLVGEVDKARRGRSLASALRVAALRSASAE